MNVLERHQRKRKALIGGAVITVFIVFLLIIATWSNVGASPAVVSPVILPHYMETFEGDGIGSPPSEAWYSYTGDYLVDNDTLMFSGYPENTYRQTRSLNLSMPANSSGCFVFNQSNYFSIDYSLFLLPDGGSLRFEFGNATLTALSLDYVYVFNSSSYVDAMDLDSDGHVNYFDLARLQSLWATNGPPGWVKSDLNFDGHVNALDISYFVGHYVPTDSWDVIYTYYNSTMQSILATYNNGWTELAGPNMLHSYLQFDWNSSGYMFYAYRKEYNTPLQTWYPTSSGPVPVMSSIDRLTIRSSTDTRAWLDNLTVGKTPYNLTVSSVSPAMNATASPTMVGCSVDQPMSMTFTIGGPAPLFASSTVYIYSAAGSPSYTVNIPASYAGYMYGKSTDYLTAVNLTTGTDYVVPSSWNPILAGQQKIAGYWYIYRPFLVFDTSPTYLPAGAVIDSVNLDLRLKENTTTTSGLLPGNVNWLEFGAFFDDTISGNHQEFPYQPVYTSPSPHLSSYQASRYDDYYTSTTIHYDTLFSSILIDASRVNTGAGASTRCIMRETSYGEAGLQSDSSPQDAVSYCKFNSSGATGPSLRITYHVPSYTWVAAAWLGNPFGWMKSGTALTGSLDDVSFNTDYYWYVNITTLDYLGGQTYSWEYPQSGTVIGSKYAYHFKTETYQSPMVTAWTPAHNSTGIPVSSSPTVNVTSSYGLDGYLQMWQFNNGTHLWHTAGSMSYQSGDTINMTGISSGYNTDTYWAVEIYDDCYPAYSAWYPNSTQNGTYVYGHKAWKYRGEIDTAPWVFSSGPANNTHFNPWLNTIYCNITNNQTGQVYHWNFYLLQGSQWANGTYFDDPMFVVEADSNAYLNDTTRFTWTPADTIERGYIFPLNNTNFSWAIKIWDDNNIVYYPTTGRYYTNPGIAPYIGTRWRNYISDWEAGNHLPSLAVTYPTTNAHYTAKQWKNNHLLHVTTADPEGDDIYLSISITYDGNYTLGSYLPLTTTLTYLDPGVYNDNIWKLSNGSYDFDLSYYIPFDNMNYTIRVIAQDSFHPRFIGYGRSVVLPFQIGTPPGELYHIAFGPMTPADADLHNVNVVANGITALVSINRQDPGVGGLFGHAANRPQLFFFLSDATAKPLSSLLPINALLTGDYMINPVIQTWSSYAGTDGYYPWTTVSLLPGALASRHQYILSMGVLTSAGLFFQGFGDYQTFTRADCEIDNLYGYVQSYGDFKFECVNSRFASYLFTGASFIEFDYAGDADFYGTRILFGTYPASEMPNLGRGWGKTYTDLAEDNGIGYAGVIYTLIICAAFCIMPYILIKRKGRNVPLTVEASFGFFGLILSYGMGFIDIWVFIIPFVIIMFIIVFKALAWITSRKQLLEDLGGR